MATSTSANVSEAGIYRHGDRVSPNGRTYTKSRTCRPETCTKQKPPGNGTIQVYWVPEAAAR